MPADPFVAAEPGPALAGVCVMQLQRTATDVSYRAAPSGESNTTEFRLFLEKEGARSPICREPATAVRTLCSYDVNAAFGDNVTHPRICVLRLTQALYVADAQHVRQQAATRP